jgi:hypothetical protein
MNRELKLKLVKAELRDSLPEDVSNTEIANAAEALVKLWEQVYEDSKPKYTGIRSANIPPHADSFPPGFQQR